jgi:hypothetical protein
VVAKTQLEQELQELTREIAQLRRHIRLCQRVIRSCTQDSSRDKATVDLGLARDELERCEDKRRWLREEIEYLCFVAWGCGKKCGVQACLIRERG